MLIQGTESPEEEDEERAGSLCLEVYRSDFSSKTYFCSLCGRHLLCRAHRALRFPTSETPAAADSGQAGLSLRSSSQPRANK